MSSNCTLFFFSPYFCLPTGSVFSSSDAMTLFHFGNCFALAYFPYFITYKCSGLWVSDSLFCGLPAVQCEHLWRAWLKALKKGIKLLCALISRLLVQAPTSCGSNIRSESLRFSFKLLSNVRFWERGLIIPLGLCAVLFNHVQLTEHVL